MCTNDSPEQPHAETTLQKANQRPNNNCKFLREDKRRGPKGWKMCAYHCMGREGSGPNWFFRLVPEEFECPPEAPYAPGIYPIPEPPPRNVGESYKSPWDYFIPCKGMAD